MTAPAQPTFVVPTASGQLSNKRGSNTGADAISMQATYRNPRQTSDAAGTIRVICNRVGVGGAPQSAQLAWDSGWVGTPTTTPAPIPGTTSSFMPWSAFVYNGRVYAAQAGTYTQSSNFPDSPLWSAPISGGSVGTWRAESSIHLTLGAAGTTQSIALVFNYGQPLIFAIDSNMNVAYAPILGGGYIGAWITATPAKPAAAGALFGNQDSTSTTQGWVGVIGQSNPSGGAGAASTSVQNVALNPDNSLQAWVNGTVLPAARCNFGFYYDGVNKFVVVAGGMDGTPTVQTTIYTAAVGALGAIGGAWSTQTNALPAVREGLGLLVEAGKIFACGGSNTAFPPGGQTTIYSAALATTVGTGQVGAWSAALTPAMPTGLTFGAWFLAGPIGAAATFSYLVSTGGLNTASTLVSTTSEILDSGTGTLSGSWSSGSNALTAGNLGTGGALVSNQDGSQNCSFIYSAFARRSHDNWHWHSVSRRRHPRGRCVLPTTRDRWPGHQNEEQAPVFS